MVRCPYCQYSDSVALKPDDIHTCSFCEQDYVIGPEKIRRFGKWVREGVSLFEYTDDKI
jgi:hypothetical protein